MSSDESKVATIEEKEQIPSSLYARQVVGNFGGGLMNPYVPIFAVQLGASPAEMGLLRSLNNLFGNLQVPWGIAADRLGKYVPFIVLGGMLAAFLWLPMLWVFSPWQIILIVAVQAVANSMVAPAWAALLGRILPRSGRARGMANVNAAASLGAITATLISGTLMTQTGGTPTEMYRIPILMAAASGFVSSLAMLTLKERKRDEKSSDVKKSFLDFKALRANVNLRKFMLISIVHSFFLSMAWPLFPITIAGIVKSNMLLVAYLSSISGGVSLFMRRYIGRLSDKAGRKTLIIVGKAGVVVYPLMYAFATSIYHLYVADFIIGILGAIADIAVFAYLLDITTEEQRGSSIALFNTFTGFTTFLGSIIGGYLVVFFGVTFGWDQSMALKAAYLVSASGRFGAGLIFLRISEQYAYPSTIRKEIFHIMVEDAKRTRQVVEKADHLGEKASQDFDDEMDRFGEFTLRDKRRLRKRSSEENDK